MYLKVGNVFFQPICCFHILLEKDVTRNFNKLESLLLKNILCLVRLKWLSCSEEEEFKKFLMYFHHVCRYFSSSIRAWHFIWSKLNPLYPRILKLCAKFVWNWGGEDKREILQRQNDRQRVKIRSEKLHTVEKP